MKAAHVSVVCAVVNNIVQKNNYYHELRLFRTTFLSELGNSRLIFPSCNPGIEEHSIKGFCDWKCGLWNKKNWLLQMDHTPVVVQDTTASMITKNDN